MDDLKEYYLSSETFDKSLTPYKEIINGEDVSNFVIALSEDNKIALKDVFRLKVNVKSVGVVFYLFNLEGFDKKKIVDAITPLKDFEVNSFESAKEKLTKLIDASKDANPLLVLFVADENGFLNNESVKELTWDIPVFCHISTFEEIGEPIPGQQTSSESSLLSPEASACVYRRDWKGALDVAKSKEEKDLIIKMFLQCSPITYSPEMKTGEEEIKKVENNKPAKVKKEKKPISFKSFFKNLWNEMKLLGALINKHKFYYLFMLVAVLLIGFTVSVGIYNCYAGKMVCIFFFICSLVGGALNYFVFYDFLKGKVLKSRDVYIAIAFVVLGVCLSLLAFFIFYISQKEKPESLTGPGLIYGLTILITIIVSTAGSVAGYLINKRKAEK